MVHALLVELSVELWPKLSYNGHAFIRFLLVAKDEGCGLEDLDEINCLDTVSVSSSRLRYRIAVTYLIGKDHDWRHGVLFCLSCLKYFAIVRNLGIWKTRQDRTLKGCGEVGEICETFRWYFSRTGYNLQVRRMEHMLEALWDFCEFSTASGSGNLRKLWDELWLFSETGTICYPLPMDINRALEHPRWWEDFK